MDQLTLKTNLLFSLVDVVETLLMEMEHDMRLQRRGFRQGEHDLSTN